MLRPSLTWRVVDREALIVDLQTGDYFSLNPIATDIWERLHVGQEPAEIATDLAAQYAMEADMVAADVGALLAQLRDAGLLNAPPATSDADADE